MKRLAPVFAFWMIAAASPACIAGQYEPLLPKASPVERVVVLDFKPEKNANDMGVVRDALHTITCLQGLYNRDSDTKVYILGLPVRLFWYAESDKGQPLNGSVMGPGGDPTMAMIEDGMLPYPISYPKLDQSKKFPVLNILLKTCKDKIRGLALIPSGNGQPVTGAQTAGVNACVFEDILPVTDDVRRYIEAEGYDFPVIYDLREMDNVEALEWSIGQGYLDATGRARTVINYGATGANPPIMNDYWVACRVFGYFLSGKNEKEKNPAERKRREAEQAAVSLFLNENNYPKGTVNIGDSEGPHLIPTIQGSGYTVVCGHVPNASVTSGIPTDPSTFRPALPAESLAIDPNAAYISFSGNDGDAIDFNLYPQYKNLKNDPARNEVPMSWKINPYFIDLFPTWFAWHTKNIPAEADLCISFNDGGAPKDEAGKNGWLNQLAHYTKNSNGSLKHMNYFGPFSAASCRYGVMKDIAEHTDIRYVFRAYQSFNTPPEWAVENGTIYSSIVGGSGDTPAELAEELAHWINETPREQPVFIMARIGVDPSNDRNARRGTVPFTMAMEVISHLEKNDTGGRPIRYLAPRDLAETAASWCRSSE